MAIIIKTPEEIEILREGGKILAKILVKVAEKIKPGISTWELDQYAYKLIKENDCDPAFLDYRPEGQEKPYPASICSSINNEIVHGIPKRGILLKEGDIISIDIGLKHKGLFTDHAATIPVGNISKRDQSLIEDTKEALEIGIWAARGGSTVGDIGHAIESFVHKRYGIVKELSGHGVGKKIHEDPYVPNFGRPNRGAKLIPGMVIAIEPMLTNGNPNIYVSDDGYTVKTIDGSRAAHFEHTILITEGDAEILTQI